VRLHTSHASSYKAHISGTHSLHMLLVMLLNLQMDRACTAAGNCAHRRQDLAPDVYSNRVGVASLERIATSKG
jgi:hypothetical protein